MILATSRQNRHAGSDSSDETILEKVGESLLRRGAPKGRFCAVKSFAIGSLYRVRKRPSRRLHLLCWGRSQLFFLGARGARAGNVNHPLPKVCEIYQWTRRYARCRSEALARDLADVPKRLWRRAPVSCRLRSLRRTSERSSKDHSRYLYRDPIRTLFRS